MFVVVYVYGGILTGCLLGGVPSYQDSVQSCADCGRVTAVIWPGINCSGGQAGGGRGRGLLSASRSL